MTLEEEEEEDEEEERGRKEKGFFYRPLWAQTGHGICPDPSSQTLVLNTLFDYLAISPPFASSSPSLFECARRCPCLRMRRRTRVFPHVREEKSQAGEGKKGYLWHFYFGLFPF